MASGLAGMKEWLGRQIVKQFSGSGGYLPKVPRRSRQARNGIVKEMQLNFSHFFWRCQGEIGQGATGQLGASSSTDQRHDSRVHPNGFPDVEAEPLE